MQLKYFKIIIKKNIKNFKKKKKKKFLKKIFFWAPFLNTVGTIKSTVNSALSLKKYHTNCEVYIINTCGEWNNHQKFCLENSIKFS